MFLAHPCKWILFVGSTPSLPDMSTSESSGQPSPLLSWKQICFWQYRFLCPLHDPTHMLFIPYSRAFLWCLQDYHFPICETIKGGKLVSKELQNIPTRVSGLIPLLPNQYCQEQWPSEQATGRIHFTQIYVNYPQLFLADFVRHIGIYVMWLYSPVNSFWHLSEK